MFSSDLKPVLCYTEKFIVFVHEKENINYRNFEHLVKISLQKSKF